MKPRVFIAASVEGLPTAYAIQENLEYEIEGTVWNQGVFAPSHYTLDNIQEELDKSDFGIFVFTPDDTLIFRQQEKKAVRDNVVFELGIFVGHLGRKRNFIVHPRSVADFKLPTDLTGLTPATYDPNRSDNNLKAALGPACNQIREAMKKLGPFVTPGSATPSPAELGQNAHEELPLLSPEATRLLLEASTSGDGFVMVIVTSGGFCLQVNGKNLVDDQSARSRALWRQSIKELVSHRLLEEKGFSSDQFELTPDGWKHADMLRVRTTKNVPEPGVSSSAHRILVTAARDTRGIVIMDRDMHSGLVIRTAFCEFSEPKNPKSAAVWKAVVEELVEGGYLEPRGQKGEIFGVTARGYKLAESVPDAKDDVPDQSGIVVRTQLALAHTPRGVIDALAISIENHTDKDIIISSFVLETADKRVIFPHDGMTGEPQQKRTLRATDSCSFHVSADQFLEAKYPPEAFLRASIETPLNKQYRSPENQVCDQIKALLRHRQAPV